MSTQQDPYCPEPVDRDVGGHRAFPTQGVEDAVEHVAQDQGDSEQGEADQADDQKSRHAVPR